MVFKERMIDVFVQDRESRQIFEVLDVNGYGYLGMIKIDTVVTQQHSY